MTRSKLRILGSWPLWSPDVREAQLGRDGERRRVLIRLLPGVSGTPEALKQLQAQAARLAPATERGLLKHAHVTAVKGQAALVYNFFAAPSLARIFETRKGLLPAKVCAEIVASVARTLSNLDQWVEENSPGHPIAHRGPSLEDILITSQGEVLVSGTSLGDQPLPLLGYSPPEGPGGKAALAYGLGALTAAIYTGKSPPASHVLGLRHKEVMRRILTELQERPGEAVPEALLRIVGACLQSHPQDRPSLSQLSAGLHRIAEQSSGLGGPP